MGFRIVMSVPPEPLVRGPRATGGRTPNPASRHERAATRHSLHNTAECLIFSSHAVLMKRSCAPAVPDRQKIAKTISHSCSTFGARLEQVKSLGAGGIATAARAALPISKTEQARRVPSVSLLR